MLTDKQVRGKLVNQGVRSLSDAELLSILLQKGEAGGSALELAERLLEAYDHNLMRIALDGPGVRWRNSESPGLRWSVQHSKSGAGAVPRKTACVTRL